MIKVLTLAASILAASFSAVFADSVPTPTTPIVRLTFSGGWCSGTYIGNGYFLTAGHCLYEAGLPDSFIAHTDTGGAITTQPSVAFNTNAGNVPDVMIVHADSVDTAWVPASLNCDYVPKAGDKISARGFPSANGPTETYMEGYVNGEPRLIGAGNGGWNMPVIPVTLPNSPGFSGGGTFDSDGKLIGIVVGSYNQNTDYSYIQSVTEACKIIYDLKLLG